MHIEAFDFARKALGLVPRPLGRVVEFGSRNINGTIRMIFPPKTKYIGVDMRPGLCVDVVADAASYKPPSGAHVVVCLEVLEHAPTAEAIVRNAVDIMMPGGHLILTCATDPRGPHSAVGEGPPQDGEYYGNVAPELVRKWLGKCKVLLFQVDLKRGDLYVLARKAPRKPVV